MRISVKWLQSLVKFTLAPEALAELLTIAGLEVEAIENRRQWAAGVVVGRVLTQKPHPNADKLSLCQVDVGGAESLSIVCGAANVRSDIFVPVAQVGAYLPAIDLKLKPTKLRGERSEGMICSLSELGLEKNSAGIHIFEEPDLQPGEDVRPLLGLDDVILDISPTANRADALSMVGMAREVAALTGGTLTLPIIPPPATTTATTGKVKVQEPEACPIYSATLVEGVTIAPSPTWLRERLEAAGVRPINNVVDITNYVLLEWGQPLHAFDLRKLQAVTHSETPTLGVRFAQTGEEFKTLDGQSRSLSPANLLVTANDIPIALAGVMGGSETEVDDQTENLILEAALFSGVVIRRSSKAQNLRSEASTRYERGVNAWQLEKARQRALALLEELTGGRVVAQGGTQTPTLLAQSPITLRLERLQRLLGPVQTGENSIPQPDVERILTALGCVLTSVSAEPQVWSVMVPDHRRGDLEREIDLIEEVARLYGYDHFLAQLPAKTLAGALSFEFQARAQIAVALQAIGLNEVIHYSLVKPQGEEVALANPLLAEYGALRTNLLNGLIAAFAYNQAQGNGALNAFEMGRIFSRNEEGIQETESLAGILGGTLYSQGQWVVGGKPAPMTWYEAKGLLESVFERLGVAVDYQPDQADDRFHPGRTASLWWQGERLGRFGQLHPQLRQAQGLMDAVYAFEINLVVLRSALARDALRAPAFRPYSPYPAVVRDLALFAPVAMSVLKLTDVIKKAAGPLLEKVELFDQYRGDSVSPGQRSLAFSLSYRVGDRTLSDQEVEPVHNRVREALQTQLAVTLRS